ncbi:MAG TPA: ABC transporter substrate-binding protein, partial [Burkholderiaceae bacterium]
IPNGTPRLKEAQEFVRFCLNPERQAIYSSMTANGPSHRDAYKFIDQAQAQLLPTYPQNLERLVQRDTKWWGKNYDKVNERFQEWLLTA